MRHIPIAALTLTLLLATAQAATTPVCAVQVTTRSSWPGRIVTVTPAPGCPPNGRAFIRFVSRTGSQPDSPPGFFPLQSGQQLTRRVPRDWWVEARDKYLRWTRQKEVVK